METNSTNKPVRPNPQGGRSSSNVVRPNNRPNPQGARPVRQAPIKPSSSSVDISKPQQTQQRQPQASQQSQQPNQQANQRQAPLQPSESEAQKKKFNYNPDKDKFASYDSIPDNPDDYASFDNYDDTQDEEYDNNEYYDTGDDGYYDEPQPVRQQRAQPYKNQQSQRRDPRYHDRRDQMYYDQQDNYDDRYGYNDRYDGYNDGYDDNYNNGYDNGYDDGYGMPIEQPIMQPDPRAYNNPNYMGMAPGAVAGMGAAGAVGLNSDNNNDLDKNSEDKIDVGKKASSALAVIGVLTGLCALLGSCWKAALVGVTFFTTKSYSAIYAIGIPSTPMIAAIASFVCGMIVYATNPNSRSRKATTRMSIFSLILCIALICVYVHTASYFD